VRELVDAERIVVDHPRPAQVALDRVPADVVVVRAAGRAVEIAQQQVERDDLERRDDDALLRFGVGLARGRGRVLRA
jgi:hypothetical protein